MEQNENNIDNPPIEKADASLDPLVNDEIIDRQERQTFTQDKNIEEGTKQAAGEGKETSQKQEQSQQQQTFSSTEGGEEEPKTFTFEDPSQQTGEQSGDSSVRFDELSTDVFADVCGNLIETYVPKMTYKKASIDINDVKKDINKGELLPKYESVFEKANENTKKALEFEKKEIDNWKYALKECLKYNQASFANPNTAFLVATGELIANQTIRMNKAINSNRQLLLQAKADSNYNMKKKSGEPNKNEKYDYEKDLENSQKQYKREEKYEEAEEVASK
jgi:hypothetical protein